MKRQKFITITLLVMIGIAAPLFISAENVLKIGQYSVQPNTEFTVQLEADNSSPFVAFQVDIPIPVGFKYIEGSSQLISARVSGHAFSASLLTGNTLRLIGYSASNTAFVGTSGPLVSFTLKSGTIPATYALELQQPMMSDNQSTNNLTNSVNGSVTVLAPNLKLSATELNYGRVPLESSAQQTFQITNEGNRDLVINSISFNDAQFSILDATPFTISANNSRSISVKFSPIIKGTNSKQLQISSNDPDQPNSTIALNAIAFAVNEIHTGNIIGASSSSATLDFSLNNMEEFTGFQFDLNLPQPMSYLPETAKLYRLDDHTVSVSQLNAQTLRVLVFSSGNKSFTGTDGKVLSLDFNLNGVAGYYSIGMSNVIIANILGENIVSASYAGQLHITSPDIDASTQLNFGDVSILSSSTKQHRIYNYGQEPLTITQLMFSNNYFKSNQTLPLTIQPNNYLELPIEFEKAVKGTATATLKIVSNDPDENPFTIQLSGNAFVPNYFLVNTQSYTQGDTKNLPVEVENEESFVAFQFDLSYPDGFTPDINAIALTDRKQDHVLAAISLTNTSLRILVYSPGQKVFTGKSGSILNIPFKAETSLLPGAYNLIFSNAVMSNITSENILYSSTNGILNILRINAAPIANAGIDQIVNEGEEVTLDGSASSDADNDAITYLWTAPEGITLNSTTVAKPTFNAPEVEVETEYTFSLVVYDSENYSESSSMIVMVKNVVVNQLSISMTSGWNWFSVYLENEDMNLDNILASLNPQPSDYIKDRKGTGNSAQFYDIPGTFTGWTGTLSEIDPKEGYKIRLNNAGDLIYQGNLVDYENEQIFVDAGWNWIGFPIPFEMSVSDYLASLDVVKGDYLKNQLVSTSYYDGYGWFGQLEMMKPGEGYLLKVANSGSIHSPDASTYIATIISKKDAVEIDAPNYSVNVSNFEFSGSAIIEVFIGGINSSNENNILYAFNKEGVCVGIAKGLLYPMTNKYLYNLMMYSNIEVGDEIHFKFYESETNELYTFEETLNFTADMIVADAYQPFVLNKGVVDFIDEIDTEVVELFPNPFTDRLNINFTVNKTQNVRVSVYDSYGKMIDLLADKTYSPDTYLLEWNAINIPVGIYYIRIEKQESVDNLKALKVK